MIEFLTADTSSTASLLVTFLPMVLILVFMYIILYLPQKKQDKKDAAMRASIEVGDTVITIGVVLLAALLLSMIRMIPLFWKPPATV